MKSLATWCVRHRLVVVILWLLALVGMSLLSQSVGTAYSNSFSLPHTESTQALDLLQAAAPRQSGDQERIVFHTTDGTPVTDPAVQASIETMMAKVGQLPHVTVVTGPYTPIGARQISADKQTAFINVTYDVQAQNVTTTQAKQLVNTALTAQGSTLQVAVSGQIAEQADRQSFGGTGLGILLAAVVLLLVFGSLFAMALPILSALASLGTAIGVIGILSNVLKMPQFSTTLVLLIGLGVGVDYALFIVTRHRQGLIGGNDVESSIVQAVNTSGRAVLFAGIIVCIALLGMFALGVSFLYGLAVAAAIGVAFTMVAALTLLPALLSFIGPKVLSRRQKKDLAANGPRVVGAGSKGFWPKWADFIRSRPIVPAVAALIIVGIVAMPFFSLRLGNSDQGNDPTGTTTRQAYDLLSAGFGPGFNGPLQLVATQKGQIDTATLDKLAAEVRTQPNVAAVVPPVVLAPLDGQQVALINVYPDSSPQASATTDLINHLRTTTIATVTAGTGMTVYVGGTTAIFADFAKVLSSKLPLFIGLVVIVSFILLAIVFRSLVIPLTAAIMNLLSIGAAFGILVAVFQWGWAGSLFQVNQTGPIEAFLPVMLFAILFGLSMDYEVFLLSRVKERFDRTGDPHGAVAAGLSATGRVITCAALIMISVFLSFVASTLVVIKMLAVGLAFSVLIDATIVRLLLVPAVMYLLGARAWWLPRWLDRVLPRLEAEGSDPGPPPGPTPSSGPGPSPDADPETAPPPVNVPA